MTMNAITKKSEASLPAVPDDPYTAFGEANTVGETYLKFDRGVYRFGPADASEILALGTLLVANMAEMKVGWLKWQDGEVVATDMRRLAEGYFVTPREELGDMDEAMWEMGNDDLPKDPWTLTTLLPLKDPATGAEYTFTTSSKGGRAACGTLAGRYGSERHKPENAGKLPVIKIDDGTYKHRKLGQIIHFPVFRLVEWRSESDLVSNVATAAAVGVDPSDEVPF
jgi:hypothetical protein